jgi:multiple sugar transport system permease protein
MCGMTSWKTWVGLLVLVGVALFFYPRAGVQRGREGKTPLVLWINLGVIEATRTAIEQFERENPEYAVQVGAATVRDVNADPTRFLLGVAGGDPPDVIFYDRFAVVEWAARGAFTDLNPYLEADRGRPDGVKREAFYSALMEEGAYKGKQYAIPTGVDIRALLMNDDMLTRAGFVNADGTIRPPKTWEEVCRKKFHGGGTVTSDGVVRLGKSGELPGVGAFPVSGGEAAANDVVTLRSGGAFFRGRVKEVRGDGSLAIDFSRDLAVGTTSVPAALVGAGDLEVKIFDGGSYAIAMTRFDAKGSIDVLGFTPLGGNSWLYMFGWQNGATFLSKDGERIELDQPEVKVALQYIVDCYDAVGGYPLSRRFEDAQKGSPISPMLSGKLAMQITGNWFLGTIAAFRSDFQFSTVPAPIPEQRLAEGHRPITWAGGFSYAIPSTAKQKDGAWKLIRFLTSERSYKLQHEVSAGQASASGRVYIPDLPVRPDLVPWLRENYIANNPAVGASLRRSFDVFTEILPESKFRPHTPISQKLWEAQRKAAENAMTHDETVHAALTDRSRWSQEALDRYLHPPTGPRVPWGILIGAYVGLLAVGALFLWRGEMKRRKAGHGRRDWKAGYTAVSPWLLGFVVFGAGPILFSLVISFCRYDVLSPAQFIGFGNYTQLLGFHTDSLTGQVVANDAKFWKSLANTAFMLIAMPLSISAGLLLAIMLNHQFRGIALFRTLFYLPSILPAVASFLLWVWIFDPARGLLNRSLMMVGWGQPPDWLSSAEWSKPAIILMGLWGIGGGMLIWLAGLKAIPVQLYEAAEIDGASPFRQFFSITLPMLSPYIFFNTVMGIIGTLQVFEAAYIMTDGGPNDSTLFYAYYLFNQAFRYLDMGAASAMAWILFAIVLSLTLFQLKVSKKWVHYD